MRLSDIALTGLMLFATSTAIAAPIQVRSVQRDADGVTLKMTPGLLKLQVCSDRIIHVVYSPTDTIPPRTSFVVIHRWTPAPFRLKSDAGAVTVITDRVQVKVNRASGAVQFLSAAGRPVLAEPPGGGKAMIPAVVNKEQTYHVEQTFVSPSGESLYGMGQYQEGLWNWRGIPLQLRQQNTQINLPMLVSSRGYGLLWDNASLTEFNPADQEVTVDPVTHAGAFTTGAAGEYVFTVRDGSGSGEIGVEVDGTPVSDINNTWVPYAIAGKATLPAGHTCAVRILGGGKGAKLYARPLGNSTIFRSEVGDTIDYTFFYGPELNDVVKEYRVATGQAPMWPKWAYGFWQCRERYSSQQQILDAAAEFRREQIPVDLLVQDWQYWGPHGWGAYEWDTDKYPDPAAMIKTLHDENFRFMISDWSDPSGITGQALKDANALIPGTSWADMFGPKGRDIRWEYMDKAFFSIGTDAWWQDATEAADGTAVEGHTVALGSGSRYRNAYPLFASEAAYEGQRGTSSTKRVVNLTRSGYPGQQRYAAACWSGDIHGDWITLRRQIPAGLNFCLAGLPYWTTDTGGFFRPADQYTSPDYNELLTRWFEWSTFCPILRIHGFRTETEMWKWPLAEKNLLAYDKLRYRLLPYNYSVAWMVTRGGYTQMRALPMDFPADKNVDAVSDQYMFGPAFLVSPVTQPQAVSRPVYLPAGTVWYDFWTGRSQAGGRTVTAAAPLETIPLSVRAGSIVPFGPPLQYAQEEPADPLELRVYRGANGAFTLYEDEGDNYNYEKGIYATIPLTWNQQSSTLTIGARRGRFPGMLARRTFRIVWVRPGHGVGTEPAAQADATVTYAGKAVTISPGRP